MLFRVKFVSFRVLKLFDFNLIEIWTLGV